MRYAVILAGGGGTRLWPLSRAARPKQFQSILGRESLLAQTARRLRPTCGDRLYVVTSEEQRALVHSALPGLPEDHVIAEPLARNTGPAIGLAAAVLIAEDPDAVLCIAPSDHHVSDAAAFAADCQAALAEVEERPGIATIGVVPSRPATGFGYLEVESMARPTKVLRFTEKPDRATAEGYLASGSFLWNAGLFFARADHLLAELRAHQPATAAVLDRITEAIRDGGRARGDEVASREYASAHSISFDYAVMEKTESVVAIPASFDWNDLGTWSSLATVAGSDENGNAIVGSVLAREAADNILYAADDIVVAVEGVSGLTVVATRDAVLVASRERAQDVRHLVEELRKSGLGDRT